MEGLPARGILKTLTSLNEEVRPRFGLFKRDHIPRCTNFLGIHGILKDFVKLCLGWCLNFPHSWEFHGHLTNFLGIYSILIVLCQFSLGIFSIFDDLTRDRIPWCTNFLGIHGIFKDFVLGISWTLDKLPKKSSQVLWCSLVAQPSERRENHSRTRSSFSCQLQARKSLKKKEIYPWKTEKKTNRSKENYKIENARKINPKSQEGLEGDQGLRSEMSARIAY